MKTIHVRATQATVEGSHSTTAPQNPRRRQNNRATAMPDGLVVHRFGAFEFDAQSRSLSHQQTSVRLSMPQRAILAHLLSHAGAIVPRDALTDAGWPGSAVNDNSLDVAIHRLRFVLGKGGVVIETIYQKGYRFAAAVDRVERQVRGPLDVQI